jgi:hypothetical protein
MALSFYDYVVWGEKKTDSKSDILTIGSALHSARNVLELADFGVRTYIYLSKSGRTGRPRSAPGLFTRNGAHPR